MRTRPWAKYNPYPDITTFPHSIRTGAWIEFATVARGHCSIQDPATDLPDGRYSMRYESAACRHDERALLLPDQTTPW